VKGQPGTVRLENLRIFGKRQMPTGSRTAPCRLAIKTKDSLEKSGTLGEFVREGKKFGDHGTRQATQWGKFLIKRRVEPRQKLGGPANERAKEKKKKKKKHQKR